MTTKGDIKREIELQKEIFICISDETGQFTKVTKMLFLN